MPHYPIDIPPGINSDDTSFAETPAWFDGSNVRFRKGKGQTIKGWSSLISPGTTLTGVCRSILAWTDNNSATLNIGFGTHSKLQLYQGGALYDITPLGPSTQLPANPFTVTNASTTVTVNHPSHGLSTSNQVLISGALSTGRQIPAGLYTVTVVDANDYTITIAAAAVVGKALASNPLSTTNGSPVVVVNEPGHNIASGTVVTFSGSAAIGGITPNGAFAITVIDANNYQFTFTSNATSTVAGGGGAAVVSTVPTTGGGAVVIAVPQVTLPAGATDGTGTDGFGTGGFGVGGFGLPSTSDYFPRTWSQAAWGQKLLASPRNGGLYEWSNNTAAAAVAVPTAPAQITQILVSPTRQVFALGCTQESGVWNPLAIRHSGVGDETQWSTDLTSSSTSREYILPGGGRIVGGLFIGRYLLVWTTARLFLGTYVGQVNQVWSFNQVADKCGLIGPNAATSVGANAFWISPDRQVWTYTPGGAPMPVECPIRKDFADNLALSQTDKIVASTTAAFGEVRWDYPDQRDGAGVENSRFIAMCVAGDPEDIGCWYRGYPLNGCVSARTARVDAGPAQFPIAAVYAGNVYYDECGNSADGGPLAWQLQSSDFALDPNVAILIREYWPDFSDDQLGPVFVTINTRMYVEASAQFPEWSLGPLVVPPGTPYLDFKAEGGRLANVLFAGNSSPSYARMGRPMFEAKPRGRRG